MGDQEKKPNIPFPDFEKLLRLPHVDILPSPLDNDNVLLSKDQVTQGDEQLKEAIEKLQESTEKSSTAIKRLTWALVLLGILSIVLAWIALSR